jgi:hypothetical protein
MNPRMLHVVCGGHNVGKTTFARYLQVGKKNVRRVCMEDLNYSIGMRSNNDNFFYALLTLLFVDGDVVIDGGDHNNAAQRVKTLKSLDRLGVSYRAFAYVIKRPVEQCYDDVYSDDEVDFSHQIQYPALREGFEKIMSVTWTDSTESMLYGDEAMMIKPEIITIHEIPSNRPIVVKPKKKTIKRKLERGRQNLFRPKKDKK